MQQCLLSAVGVAGVFLFLLGGDGFGVCFGRVWPRSKKCN